MGWKYIIDDGSQFRHWYKKWKHITATFTLKTVTTLFRYNYKSPLNTYQYLTRKIQKPYLILKSSITSMTVVQNCDLVVTFSIPTNQPCPSFSRFATMLIIHLSKRTMPILFFYILPCWLKGTTYPPSLILCGLKDYTHCLHSSMLTEQQCPSSSSFVHWKQPFPFSSFFLVDLKQMFYPLYSWLEISCWLKKKLSIVQSVSLTEENHFQSS